MRPVLLIFTSCFWVADVVVARLSRAGGAGSTGRAGSFGVDRAGGCVGQVGSGRVSAMAMAACRSVAQGQVAGMRIFRLRWPRTRRAAVCRSR